jgi:hypothetical protein
MKTYFSTIRHAILLSAILVAGHYAQAQTSAPIENDAILLIDINNVVPEIEVIEKYLRENEPNTKLVLVPSERRIPRDVRKRIQDIHANSFDRDEKWVENNWTQAKENAKDPQLMAMKAKNAQTRALLASLKNGSRQDGELTVEDMKADIAEALNSGSNFSRVIISGHHSADPTNGYLAGEMLGGMSSDIIKPILNADARLQESVRSVMMLGCWTGLESMMKTSWGQLLPRAKFHSGFITPAPLKTDPKNLATLESLLKAEKVIGASESDSVLLENYKRIKLFDRKIGVMVNGKYIPGPGQLKQLN